MSREPLTSSTTTDPGTHDDADGGLRQTYLSGQLTTLIDRFDSESTSHKKLFRRLRYIVFGLTACSSALAGLALAFPTIQTGTTVGVILTTTAIGIATSVEGLRKPNELWIHERTIYYSLKDLERELGYFASEPKDSKRMDAYFVRLQSILGSSRDKWSRDIAAGAPAAARQDFASPAGSSATLDTDSE
jgi:hypothetical protein